MNEILTQLTKGLKLGRLKSHGPLGLIPIFQPEDGGPDYLTMGEAIEKGLLAVSEVSEGGHVPELKVINGGDKSVLLLDGEELKGAKQNRVINTTILIPERSERVIPVSCTEHGRWHSMSTNFQDSGVVMSRNIRAEKNRSVSCSLQREGTYESDQGQVWDEIADLTRKAGVRSKTGAMRDVFNERKGELDKLAEEFSCAKDQKGLIAFIHGEVAGVEMLSSSRVFRLLFPKLLRSYAMEAQMVKGDQRKHPSAAKAKTFLDHLEACKISRHPSVGYGEDVRFQSKTIVGSALVHEKSIIHAAFFALQSKEPKDSMSRMGQRRMVIEELE